LAVCRTLLPAALRLEAPVRDGLVRIWEGLLAQGAIQFSVIEDPTRSGPDSIEAFGASVFVSDDFTGEFCARPRPYLPSIVYERIAGGASPVLSTAQLRAANSDDGLNLAVLHFGLRHPDMENERTRRALQAGNAAFYFLHAGYRLKLLINEVYGPQHAHYMSAGGFRLVTDFRDGSLDGVADEEQPYLFAQRREWIAPGAVNPLALLFHAPRPQLGLAAREQAVILRALLNESDNEIASAMTISLDAVKKTWRRAYDRVAVAAPSLLGKATAAASNRRGTEKRRHLLEYLRDHLEELRPTSKRAG